MTNVHLVVMGVAGCGKSTVAEELRDRLGWELAEGDDFHPEANIEKMSSGTPLTDEDRWPWLDLIAEWTAEQDAAGKSTIVTCSALRKIYRDRLRAAPGRTIFVHLVGSPELLEHRLSARSGHFMPPTLLPSQLATLEPLDADEEGVILDVYHSIETIAQLAINQLHLQEA
ncbi:MAG: gluconokinase [Tessaracoccus sp.]|uniref:gluconokinase n=1 Tax=Tessaracoccus sp. TaxID=1971211 RepID=UPI001EB364D5|nr:gluconokinase [Tessaracoccus sp.]MBK7820360.1 gluconokinase [Tessaracoccus sp.]